MPVVTAHLAGTSSSDNAGRQIDGILYVPAGADRDPKPESTCQTAGDSGATGLAAPLALLRNTNHLLMKILCALLVQTVSYHKKHKVFILHIHWKSVFKIAKLFEIS